MSEEKYTNGCICSNKYFKKTLSIAIGTFIGVYCALSLFCAIHKPPMPIPVPVYNNTAMLSPNFAPRTHHFGGMRKFMAPPQMNQQIPGQKQSLEKK